MSTRTGSLNIEEELNKMAHNKLLDIVALRTTIGESPEKYYGMMEDVFEETEDDVRGYVVKKVKRLRVHPLVDELHKAEAELKQMLSMLKEYATDVDENELDRIRKQTARETARLMKAYPGLGVDQAAAEVTKRV